MNRVQVRFTEEAEFDLNRLLDHLIDRAATVEYLVAAANTSRLLRESVKATLGGHHPMIFRKAADSPFLRELIVPLGATGYVALFEVMDATMVHVVAVRHQREDDYH
jgi:plasmid stabilization system protein ParE